MVNLLLGGMSQIGPCRLDPPEANRFIAKCFHESESSYSYGPFIILLFLLFFFRFSAR